MVEESVKAKRRKVFYIILCTILVITSYYFITHRKTSPKQPPKAVEVIGDEAYLDEYVSFTHPDNWFPFLEASTSAQIIHAVNLGNPKVPGVQVVMFQKGALADNQPIPGVRGDGIVISGIPGIKQKYELDGLKKYYYGVSYPPNTFAVYVEGAVNDLNLEEQLDKLVKTIRFRK